MQALSQLFTTCIFLGTEMHFIYYMNLQKNTYLVKYLNTSSGLRVLKHEIFHHHQRIWSSQRFKQSTCLRLRSQQLNCTFCELDDLDNGRLFGTEQSRTHSSLEPADRSKEGTT